MNQICNPIAAAASRAADFVKCYFREIMVGRAGRGAGGAEGQNGLIKAATERKREEKRRKLWENKNILERGQGRTE
ncbi:hypothetical protein EVAR_62808_1 [Eumeta japonica]|uniref:Uncharacterized protein n=1 Tax=Eumeta variegata TaxID=151549 RepID=A0A4C1ZNH2_EUMVA|nr:hypothetical protein EVAR_62808_1 [Eumeta japonica]